MARPLAAITLRPVGAALRAGLGLLAVVVLIVGMAELTDRAGSAGWMLWCYVALVAVWPYAPDRFLWGALPWIAIAFATGASALIQRSMVDGQRSMASLPSTKNHKPWSLVGWLAAATIASGFAITQVRGLTRGYATSTQVGISATMNDILPWIRSSTDTSAVIAGEDEALIWLYTGRRAVPSYLWRVRGRDAESLGADSLHAWLERSGATHMVLTGPGSDAAPTIDAL